MLMQTVADALVRPQAMLGCMAGHKLYDGLQGCARATSCSLACMLSRHPTYSARPALRPLFYSPPAVQAEDEASCPSAIAIGTLQFVLEHSQPSLLPVAAATPDLLRQLAALAGRPRVLGTTIPELNRPVRRRDWVLGHIACRLPLALWQACVSGAALCVGCSVCTARLAWTSR